MNAEDKPRQALEKKIPLVDCLLEDSELAKYASNRTFCVM